MQKWLQNKDQIDLTDLLVILVFSSIPDVPDVPSLLFIHMPPYTTRQGQYGSIESYVTKKKQENDHLC